MKYRCLFVFAAVCVLHAETPPDLRGMMRQAQQNLLDADKKLADYSYMRFNVRRELNPAGGIKNERTVVARRDFVDGVGFTRVVERDGKPVPEAERRREDETIRKTLAELKAGQTGSIKPKTKDPAQRANQREALLNEFPEALDYRKIGEEDLGGRRAIVLECWPRTGYEPKNLIARLFGKMRGKVWLDQADLEIAKLDVEMYDAVGIGLGVIARIEKGTHFFVDRARLADGLWFPQAQTLRLSARMLLVKSLAQEETTKYSGYRHKGSAQ
jgi:hypothetical protein